MAGSANVYKWQIWWGGGMEVKTWDQEDQESVATNSGAVQREGWIALEWKRLERLLKCWEHCPFHWSVPCHSFPVLPLPFAVSDSKFFESRTIFCVSCRSPDHNLWTRPNRNWRGECRGEVRIPYCKNLNIEVSKLKDHRNFQSIFDWIH